MYRHHHYIKKKSRSYLSDHLSKIRRYRVKAAILQVEQINGEYAIFMTIFQTSITTSK